MNHTKNNCSSNDLIIARDDYAAANVKIKGEPMRFYTFSFNPSLH